MARRAHDVSHDVLSQSDIENNNAIPQGAEQHLCEAVAEMRSRLAAIEHQRAEVSEERQDVREPAEGQFPGYDNKIQLAGLMTAIPYALKRLDVADDDDLWETKVEVRNRYSELKSQCVGFGDGKLDAKEAFLLDVNDLLEDIIDLFEQNDQRGI